MTSSGIAPPALPWTTAFVAIVGLMGTVFNTVLDHGDGLPAALYGTAIVGVVATALVTWMLSRVPSLPTSPRGPQPPALA